MVAKDLGIKTPTFRWFDAGKQCTVFLGQKLFRYQVVHRMKAQHSMRDSRVNVNCHVKNVNCHTTKTGGLLKVISGLVQDSDVIITDH